MRGKFTSCEDVPVSHRRNSLRFVLSGLYAVMVALAYATESDAANPPEQSPESIAKEAMQQLVTGGIPKMADALFQRSVIPDKVHEEMKSHFGKIHDGAVEKFGKPTGEFEFVSSETVGQSFEKVIYLEKLETHAIVWRFTFYRTKGEWLSHSVNFSDNLEPLFRPKP